jgi:uncharacterized membrane-anchored protein
MHVKNVPMLDLRYWIAILLASIMGTAFGDFISGDLKFGFAGGLLTLSAVIAAIFIAERCLKWHTVIWYWAAIEATRMAATNLGDFLSTTLRLGNGLVAAMLAVLLALFLFVTRRAPGSNDGTRRKSLPETNPRYWAAILIASTLGTTLGDFVSGDLGLGLRLGSVVLGALLALVVTIELHGRTASEPRYWVAVAVARTSGTIMGDYMTSERGVNFGCAWGASLAFILLVGVLIFPGSLLAFPMRSLSCGEVEETTTREVS